MWSRVPSGSPSGPASPSAKDEEHGGRPESAARRAFRAVRPYHWCRHRPDAPWRCLPAHPAERHGGKAARGRRDISTCLAWPGASTPILMSADQQDRRRGWPWWTASPSWWPPVAYEDAYLTFQGILERLGTPEALEASRWLRPAGCSGCPDGLSIASIGGKDSMSGSF